MIRLLFRLCAAIALAQALILAVLDATRTVAASSLVLTPLSTTWNGLWPDALVAFQNYVSQTIHPALWDPMLTFVLRQPGFVVFAGLALVFYAVGRRPVRRVGRFAVEH